MIGKTKHELVLERNSLYAELYMICGRCSLSYVEAMCRKINALSLKIKSFNGGLKNDKDREGEGA